MPNNDGGNLRVKDEKRDVWLKETFHNVSASHDAVANNKNRSPHYIATITVPYYKFLLSGKKLWQTLYRIKQSNGLIGLMGQFYYESEPYVMKIDHLQIVEMVITAYEDKYIIKFEVRSLPESRLIELKGKVLKDMKLGEPFVFR